MNIGIEFSAEELESALITPNGILDDIHIPLLRVRAFWVFEKKSLFLFVCLFGLLNYRWNLLDITIV